MTMWVAMEYKVEPLVVANEWHSLEVLLAYGMGINAISMQSYVEYKVSKGQLKLPAPTKYAVKFKNTL